MGFISKQKMPAATEAEQRDSGDCPGLAEALADRDPAVRRRAARELSGCPDSAVALVNRLHNETNGAVREAILGSLTVLRNEVAVAGLVNCLRSEDAALRNEAIEAMKQLPDEVAPIMDVLLGDPNSDVRILAINILESLRHPKVEEWLARVIDRDTHVNVCATALDLLGEVGSERSREPLERLKARFPDEPYIGFAVELALKRLDAS